MNSQADQTEQVETYEFQAESRQLLQLVVHSIYSNKDIFLRELISNSSDALDKLRLESLRDSDLDADTSDLHIALEADPGQRTLTVRDNGIGMSREEVVQLIGTIAKSGTAEFARKLKEAQESKDGAASARLIGNFGVGFYSSFMVADKVTLVTRRAGESTGTRWESSGEGTYTLQPVEDAPQGTSVTLHLKPEDTEDALFDYSAEHKIREIVRQHSDFIPWPIRLATERTEDGETKQVTDTVNSMKALWARSPEEIKEEEYQEFYKHVSHDWNDPLETLHTRAEGTFEYQALLFIPSRAPLDLFQQGARRGVHLYVKRVFIMDDCESLLPDYLRFVKGVVDAQDLSLNVSRENLQQDRQIQLMHRRLVKKVLSTVKSMRTKDADRYRTFWGEFGRAVKEGLLSDYDNREAILDICSFPSTHDPEQQTSLRDYVSRMQEGQEHIYYLTGESRSLLENSPHMEAFRDKGLEVLLLTDPVDEVWVEQVREFDGTALKSIAKGQVDLDSEKDDKEEDPERAQQEKDFAGLLSWMTSALAEDVKEVRLSSRLTTSPACIVGDSDDVTPTLEKMYRAMGQEIPRIKRILELNPTHPLVTALRASHAKDPLDGALPETAELLHGMALLAEGGELKDPARFTRVLAGRLAAGL
ncbi:MULTISPECIES: molecular chaperone HtpG [Streptomyces]|uniref:Chaperone protein HtpG n=1 Tax=Streptomyces albus (strain ATCC 21838 / DSM 41398 / FERM P-419 / JCM 4703 / NBRC 107858) TaxID=1081613 RepID=A0A0B5EJD0_STRA4|nr:molecular chaperone HtpG [Streptomyces sp. SCSIO ZS0520]AJE82348.1 molecular chaperone HtpG [Streptomyces albus]AOU76664.1 molecular chaperone HtpG [Streptomyces albus]AYN32445.1 molecular chaperone HtpG [Streptomyces albus]